MYLTTYVPIYLSIYLSNYLRTYLSIYLSIYLTTYVPIYLSIYLPIYLSIYLSVYLFIYLSVCLSVCIFIHSSIYSCFPNLEHSASVESFVSLQFLNLREAVEFLGRVITPTQGRCLHRTSQTQNKRRETSMRRVVFEPTIPAFERAKTVHASDRAATVIGSQYY
jgi:hypothetical protein